MRIRIIVLAAAGALAAAFPGPSYAQRASTIIEHGLAVPSVCVEEVRELLGQGAYIALADSLVDKASQSVTVGGTIIQWGSYGNEVWDGASMVLAIIPIGAEAVSDQRKYLIAVRRATRLNMLRDAQDALSKAEEDEEKERAFEEKTGFSSPEYTQSLKDRVESFRSNIASLSIEDDAEKKTAMVPHLLYGLVDSKTGGMHHCARSHYAPLSLDKSGRQELREALIGIRRFVDGDGTYFGEVPKKAIAVSVDAVPTAQTLAPVAQKDWYLLDVQALPVELRNLQVLLALKDLPATWIAASTILVIAILAIVILAVRKLRPVPLRAVAESDPIARSMFEKHQANNARLRVAASGNVLGNAIITVFLLYVSYSAYIAASVMYPGDTAHALAMSISGPVLVGVAGIMLRRIAVGLGWFGRVVIITLMFGAVFAFDLTTNSRLAIIGQVGDDALRRETLAYIDEILRPAAENARAAMDAEQSVRLLIASAQQTSESHLSAETSDGAVCGKGTGPIWAFWTGVNNQLKLAKDQIGSSTPSEVDALRKEIATATGGFLASSMGIVSRINAARDAIEAAGREPAYLPALRNVREQLRGTDSDAFYAGWPKCQLDRKALLRQQVAGMTDGIGTVIESIAKTRRTVPVPRLELPSLETAVWSQAPLYKTEIAIQFAIGIVVPWLLNILMIVSVPLPCPRTRGFANDDLKSSA